MISKWILSVVIVVTAVACMTVGERDWLDIWEFAPNLNAPIETTETIWATIERLAQEKPIAIYILVLSSPDPHETKTGWGSSITLIPNVVVVGDASKATHVMRISFSETYRQQFGYGKYATYLALQTVIELEDTVTSLIVHQSKNTAVQINYNGEIKRIKWIIE